MFEKQAKEYSIENYETCLYDDFPYTNDARAREQSFKDGAEFGYNKANEWHYVKDGDFPKENGNYIVAWERTHHVEEYGKWGFDVDLFNVDEGYFEGARDFVIAWREIVPPKENE